MTWLIGLVILASSIAFAWLVLSWWHLRCGSSTGTTGRRRRQIRRADRAKDVAFADDATDSPTPVVTHWSRNADNGRLAAHYSCEPPGHLPGRQLQGAPSAEGASRATYGPRTCPLSGKCAGSRCGSSRSRSKSNTAKGRRSSRPLFTLIPTWPPPVAAAPRRAWPAWQGDFDYCLARGGSDNSSQRRPGPSQLRKGAPVL